MRATIAWKSAAFFLVALLAGGALALGQSGETVGLITEIKVARGTAEVKTAAGVRRTARPLLALRAGDQIHTTEDAAVVVVLTAGRGAVRVDARTTPWTAPPVGDPGKFDKAQSLVTSSLRFLTGAQQEAAEALLISRAGGGPPADRRAARNHPRRSGRRRMGREPARALRCSYHVTDRSGHRAA
jgi:hypothetical protein